MMKGMEDLYAILGLGQGASVGDVKRSYRDLALKCHPDRNPLGAAAFQRIAAAYETLGDEHKKRSYDAQWMIQQRMQQGGQPYASATSARPQSAHTTPGSRSMWSGTWRQPDAKPFPTGSSGRPQSASHRPAGSTFAADYSSSTGGVGGAPAPSSTATAARAAPPPPPPTAAPPQASPHVSAPTHDTSDDIDADRLRAQSKKRIPTVSAYNIPAAEREHLQSMKERFEAAQEVDLSAWERIRKRPTSASTASRLPPPSHDGPADPPPPAAPATVPEGRPVVRPASARPFPRVFIPPSAPKSGAESEALKRFASASDILGRAAASAQQSPPQPTSKTGATSATAPQRTAEQREDEPPQRPTPSRPFSAGVHRFQPNHTAATATTTPPPPPAPTSPTPSTTEPVLVPSDKDISELSHDELKRLADTLERKLRLVRQASLIKSLS